MNFEDFKLDSKVLEGIQSMGFSQPTAIQQQAIPPILDYKDVIGCAQTGTGKTAAYVLPVLHHIIHEPHTHLNTLIISPTRELALQIDQGLEGLSYFTSISSLAVYGGGDGGDFERQKKALIKGTDIIIATPGKLISHLNLGYVPIDKLKHLILDEADRMLDMGFHEDIMKIVSHLPVDRQTLMFSATMPARIRHLANKILKNPVQINIAVAKPAEGIYQGCFYINDKQKNDLVLHLVTARNLPRVLIFCGTKVKVKLLERQLKDLGVVVKAIHSDLAQVDREKVFLDFKNKSIQVLVATDVLSRGIDIEGIDLIINYDVPHDEEDYVHRIGRTARASSTGVAFTLVNEQDLLKFSRIEKFLGQSIPKMKLPDSIGAAPIFEKPKRREPRGKNFQHKKRRKNRP
ncbi:MAG: DEAD/DEAH box helicase [Bacteroidetes bacterium]|nr:DEAD/DEAH box helicase [Bacteroidota bacterium]